MERYPNWSRVMMYVSVPCGPCTAALAVQPSLGMSVEYVDRSAVALPDVPS
jgi:hypothetical protein